MSYQVIARKWRPKDFGGVVGQSHVSQTLLNALRSGRLPHALLFTGPRGTGKTSSARILAKSLRCSNNDNFVPCGTCQDCEEINRGQSVNVIEIDGASNNGVEAIRDLRESVGYMPSSGTHKVYIIDEVHMLSTSAFNALLKTLEEPPEHVIFVMATTEVQKIPNTILSRCQRFDFRKISLKLVTEHLKSICDADEVSADNDALWVIARQGEGSMRDAQSLLDQVITFSDKHITMEKVVEVLGLTDRSLLLETTEALVNRNTEAIVQIIGRIFKSGYDPKVYIQDLLEELRHLILVKVCKGQVGDVVDLPQEEISRLHQLSEPLSEEDIHLLFDMALKGGNDLSRAQDSRIVLEMLLLRMAQAPRIQNLLNIPTQAAESSATQSTNSTNNTQQRSTPSAKPVPSQTRPAPATKPAAAKTISAPVEIKPTVTTPNSAAPKPTMPTGQSYDEKWHDLVGKIKKINGLVGAQLDNTYLLEMTESSITVGVPEKVTFLFEKLNTTDFKNKMANYLNTFWGTKLHVNVVSGNKPPKGQTAKVSIEPEKKTSKLATTPKALTEQKQQAHNQAVREEVENHPLVQKIQASFDTEIKTIKETAK